MIRRQELSKAIDQAYHEHYCGTPPSCGNPRRCEGRMEPAALQAVVDTAFAALAHERAAQPPITGFVWCHAHFEVHEKKTMATCDEEDWEPIRFAGPIPKWR